MEATGLTGIGSWMMSCSTSSLAGVGLGGTGSDGGVAGVAGVAGVVEHE